jgi:putative phosphoesterase
MRGFNMKIGVISDTHIPKRAKIIPQAVFSGLQGVDLILHAGDWQDLSVYNLLQTIAPVDGVAGNVDGAEIIQQFGRKKVLKLEGFNIGLIHGDGKGKTTIRRAYDAFVDEQVDIIIFGHSHIPYLKRHEGILLFNPGSATEKRRQDRYSFGIIEIGDELKVKHIYYEQKD